MSRKGKPKEPRPRQVDSLPKPASATAFNYSWRTGVALPALVLTLLIFLALPFYPEVAGYPRWLVAAIGAGELPAALSEAFGSAGGLTAIGERALIVAKAAFGLALAAGIGVCVVLGVLRGRELGEVETYVLGTTLGLAALSLLTFSLSLAGGGGRFVLYASLALLPAIVLAALFLKRRGQRLVRSLSSPGRGLPEFPVGLWLILGVPATIFVLLWGINPPYDFDVLEYHFEVPKEWHASGIDRTEGNVYGAMPQGAEMFVLWGMSFDFGDEGWRGALIGKAILALVIPLTSLLAASIAGRIAGRSAGRSAGLLAGWTALTVPWLWSVGAAGLVDHVWGLYFLAASWTAFRTWFDDRDDLDEAEPVEGSVPVADRVIERAGSAVRTWRLRRKPSVRWAALAGAFFGAAAACKYPAVPLIGGPLIVFHLACFVVASRRTGFDLARFAKASGVACFAALILGGGWYVKNVALYGNPVFPLMTGLFGDAGWPEELQANWAKAHQVPGATAWERWSPVGLAGWAFRWTFSTSGASVLVPLGLLALVFTKRPPRAVWIFLALAGGYFLLFWLATHRIDRFLVPTYPLLAVAAGVGFAAGASSLDRQMRQVAFWLGLVVCVLAIPYQRIETYVDARLLAPLDRLRVADGFGDLPPRVQPPVEWLNRNVEEGTVLSVGDAAVFDFEVPVRYHTCFDESPLQVWYDEAGGDPATLRKRLNDEGISFVYVNWKFVELYRSPGNYGFPFPVVDRDQFAKFVEQGVLLPSVDVGPPMENSGTPRWEIYPVASDDSESAPSTAGED